MAENKDCIECNECDPDEHPNECYLSACEDIVLGKVDFECIGKRDQNKKSGDIPKKRKPDKDLMCAFQNSNTEFTLDEIDDILAEIAGANDEFNWYWLVILKNKKYALIDAWCDYTGWDCQSGVTTYLGDSPEDVLKNAPEEEKYSHRKIRIQLRRQLIGEQPFGVCISEDIFSPNKTV